MSEKAVKSIAEQFEGHQIALLDDCRELASLLGLGYLDVELPDDSALIKIAVCRFDDSYHEWACTEYSLTDRLARSAGPRFLIDVFPSFENGKWKWHYVDQFFSDHNNWNDDVLDADPLHFSCDTRQDLVAFTSDRIARHMIPKISGVV